MSDETAYSKYIVELKDRIVASEKRIDTACLIITERLAKLENEMKELDAQLSERIAESESQIIQLETALESVERFLAQIFKEY